MRRTIGGVLAALLMSTCVQTTAWAAKPVCGDGDARGQEECDGSDLRGQTCTSLGYAGGQLSCNPTCTIDTSSCSTGGGLCGDDVVEGFEECDGASDTACPGVCSSHCACPGTGAGGLEVHVVDVGQGDGIVVISPDGFTLLVDGGPEGEASTLLGYLASIGVTNLDYTLVSHMHADHVGAMDLVLQNHPEVVSCFDHGSSFTTNEYDEYDTAASGRRIPVFTGQFIDLGPSMTAEVLHADTGNTTNENLNSVVVKLTYGAQTLVLGGDCEGPCESTLDTGPIQVYKVHHHGAGDSSTDAFLDRMDAYTALISAGGGNLYGHPHQETLDRLAAHEAAVYRTDLEGDLIVDSDGTAYTVNGEPVCTLGQLRTCGTSDVGACSLGTRDCVATMWGSCQGAIDPIPESCTNGVDDDCDGLTDTNDPDCTSDGDHIVVAQVGYDTPGTDALEEFVDLYNPTTSEQPLDGWTLQDNAGSWQIPNGTSILAGATLSIGRDPVAFHTLYGMQPDVSGLSLDLSNSGDRVVLLDAASGEVDRVAWENFEPGWSIAASTGDSIERMDPSSDTDTVQDWSVTSPAAPRGGEPGTCGNGTCDAGEDCSTCSADCSGQTSGKPANRWCCGNATCEPVGEDAEICPIDCAQ